MALKTRNYICIDPVPVHNQASENVVARGFAVTESLQKTFVKVMVKLDSLDGKYKAGQIIYISANVHNSAKIVGKVPNIGDVWLIPEDLVLMVEDL